MLPLAVTALAVSLATTWALIPVARKLDLLAKPGEHRMYEQPTPLVGGIAIFKNFSASGIHPLTVNMILVLLAHSRTSFTFEN